MAALQLLSLLLLTSPALADPGPGRSADGRRHAAPLPQGRFPAERLVPPGFRGPNVLEKLAAGSQGEGEGVHAENLAWIFEHVGHAMKAQDTNTRRLREEDGGAGDGGAGAPPPRGGASRGSGRRFPRATHRTGTAVRTAGRFRTSPTPTNSST